MDETIVEILSRHLDGDLNADEELELSARLEAEPALIEELEAMRRIRRSVAALASSEQVPPELDSLVDPLLRGKPEPIALRPWARWLATAAAVILGATVIIEVNRRNPGPSIESMAKLRKEGHPAEPTERFTLAPLPTSSLPPEQQPLGAAWQAPLWMSSSTTQSRSRSSGHSRRERSQHPRIKKPQIFHSTRS